MICPPEMRRTAVLSPCKQFRYSLGRDWLDGDGRVLWVMLNPSRGDATKDDQTIRKCVSFSQRWGFSQLSIVNLMGYRTAYPRELLLASQVRDVVGPENAEHIAMEVRGARMVIVAWGGHGTRYTKQRDASLAQLRELTGDKLWCLGLTLSGDPRHPLMETYAAERELFRGHR